MSTLMILTLCAIAAIFAVLAIYVVIIYNKLIHLSNQAKKAWANIDVLLKQRNDEIPALLRIVKIYLKHEKNTLTTLAKIRKEFDAYNSKQKKANASNIINKNIKKVFMIAENYPKLTSNKNFIKLQTRLSNIETIIADKRSFYNETVQNYNTRIESIPDIFIAKIFKMKNKELFKA